MAGGGVMEGVVYTAKVQQEFPGGRWYVIAINRVTGGQYDAGVFASREIAQQTARRISDGAPMIVGIADKL